MEKSLIDEEMKVPWWSMKSYTPEEMARMTPAEKAVIKDRWTKQALSFMSLLGVIILLFLAVYIRAITIGCTGPYCNKVISCYYNIPIDKKTAQLIPEDINAAICTHINVGFARIVDKEIALNADQIDTIKGVVQLKEQNKKLKVLLSVGGAGADRGFSDMVIDHASRKTFIKSIKITLKNLELDGIDLDWEFPAVHKSGDLKDPPNRERQHFSQLLAEIRKEYIREKKDYLLTVAAAAPQIIVDAAYDVDQLELYTDYVNIMTYDYHFYNRVTPFTGLNSPLYRRAQESLYLATLNIDYTVKLYLDKGLSKEKIVVGIPTYGHSFRLLNDRNTGIGSPAVGYGMLGSMGFVDFPDICNYMGHYEGQITIVNGNDTMVPYFYRGFEWVSYETRESVMEKANYINDMCLRGAMIYSLNADDYEGRCNAGGNEKFPLSHSVKDALIGDVPYNYATGEN